MSTETDENETRLTGGAVARAAAYDFRSFYWPGAALKVRISVEGVPYHAALRTNPQGSRIAISRDMAEEEIDSPEKLFFNLLIVAHEIAHLVHRHNHPGPRDRLEDINLEFWADFYSGKVLITLLTYGTRLRPMLNRYYPGRVLPFAEVLEAIGKAVARLVETVYSDDPRYPPKLLRASLISNGVTSALRRELINPHPIWYFSVIKRVLLASPTIQTLARLHPEHVAIDREQMEAIRTWHRERQGGDQELTPGLLPRFADHLHTRFDHSDEERAAMEQERRAEIAPYYGIDDE